MSFSYQTPTKKRIQVTAAVIRQDGKILITKRPEGVHLEGMWEFPGGKRESRETLEDCMAREIKEELGIIVKVGKQILKVEHEYEEKTVDLNIFECVIIDGEPSPNEGQEMKWVNPGELSEYDFPPPDREIIELMEKE